MAELDEDTKSITPLPNGYRGYYGQEFGLDDSGVELFLQLLEAKGNFIYNKRLPRYKDSLTKKKFYISCEEQLMFGKQDGETAKRLYERLRLDFRKAAEMEQLPCEYGRVNNTFPFMDSARFLLPFIHYKILASYSTSNEESVCDVDNTNDTDEYSKLLNDVLSATSSATAKKRPAPQVSMDGEEPTSSSSARKRPRSDRGESSSLGIIMQAMEQQNLIFAEIANAVMAKLNSTSGNQLSPEIAEIVTAIEKKLATVKKPLNKMKFLVHVHESIEKFTVAD